MRHFLTHPALLVFLGGGLGSLLRYGFGQWVPVLMGGRTFPLAILLANVLASAVLGLVAGALASRMVGNELRWLVGVGFCGGLSTFSSFSVDTLLLFQQGRAGVALFNIGLNVTLCLTASAAGFWAVSVNS